MGEEEILIRRAQPQDMQAILDVASASLGWRQHEPNAQLFEWKHLHGRFGPSPLWVAESAGRVVGYRAFMRWEFLDAEGCVWRAVRAVDTATHPDFQRRGIFSRLTSAAVEELVDEGLDLVFNTPNDASRPGYLKLGWVEIGRLPVAFRPTSVRSVAAMAGARSSAEKWSEPSTAGSSFSDFEAEHDIGALAADQPPSPGLVTRIDGDFLRWRFGSGPLEYRVWSGAGGPSASPQGCVIFRTRRRGAAIECVVAAVLTPAGGGASAARLLRGLAREVDADYLLRIGGDARSGFVTVPGQGPRLVARELTSAPPTRMRDWSLTLGDIEVF